MKLLTREDVGLRPPRGYTELSTDSITAHYGGGGPGVIPHDQCLAIWRAWQNQHMDTDQLTPGGAADIAYNLGGCQHGWVIEGRGPGRRSAANGTSEANGASLAIVFIGGGTTKFTDEAKQAFLDGADYLSAKLDHVHKDWVNTGCPDSQIVDWVRSGPTRPDRGDSDMADSDMINAKLDQLLSKTQFSNDVLHRMVRGFHPQMDAYGGAEGFGAHMVWMAAMIALIWDKLNDEQKMEVRSLVPEFDPIDVRVRSNVLAANFAELSDEPYDMSREISAGD